jgi:hypothetical protein
VKSKFNAYSKTLTDCINSIYVVCPKCEEQAMVTANALVKEQNEREVRLVCPACGMNKYWSETPAEEWMSNSGRVYNFRTTVLGGTVDPYFKLPLWLQKETAYGVLWAYNYEHLEFIEKHVHSELRYRKSGNYRNKSVGSRLPKWITAKKSRTEVLKAIARLKQV